MLTYKRWIAYDSVGRAVGLKDGWFLFGILPLYLRHWKDDK